MHTDTWDVVGKATFSKEIGYLEKGFDFDGTLWASERAIDYFAVVGQYPILDFFFDKNPVYRIGPPGFGVVTHIAVNRLIERFQGKDTNYNPAEPDFMEKFIEAKKAFSDSVDDNQIVSWMMVNMIAGADTTAITIRAAMYHALKHPRVWARLEKEILASDIPNNLPASYKNAFNVSYLEAVVREGVRMHPGVGLLLERYVPDTGFTFPDGKFAPPGAVLGMNPYVIARNKEVYGEDAESYRPERWLLDEESGETEEEFQTRLRRMNNADLTFGAGSRFCLGKHLGLVETYKAIATLVAQYKIELAYPERDWKVINSWFVRQEGFLVKMSKRN